MTRAPESLVLVEGYDDRDFWRGLLLRCGCVPERQPDPPPQHKANGVYYFTTSTKALICVVPYQPPSAKTSSSDLHALIKLKLRERVNKPIRRLVVSPDADTHATLEGAAASVRDVVLGACAGATVTPEGDIRVDGGQLIVSPLLIHGDAARNDGDRLPAGTPVQPALEQLACAALCRVYPDRGEAVARWLADRPAPIGKDHKAHAWSFYAGWSTDHGTGDFYGSLWRDDAVAAELEGLLRAQRAWRVIEALTGVAAG
jgi:hypothetical protein